jgi:thiamine-monophosphate kinase
MIQLEKIFANQAIRDFAHHFSRSPQQSNRLHETDAELIALDSNRSHYLAVTIDTIADEISEGLYRDPFTMGWVTVMANFSDLAAVGAEPIGIVTAISLERSRDEAFRSRIAQGMEEACRQVGAFILGGDLNFTQSISLTGCAIGTVPRNKKLMRVGCMAGDVIFLSGKAGSGNALGLARKTNLPEEVYPEKSYRPIARTREALLVRKYASCCMDTSDGLFITIDQLIRLNNLGFSIEADWENVLEKKVFKLCKKMNVPFWFMAAGIHGEFELLFTVPVPKIRSFLREAHRMDFYPLSLGKIINVPDFEIILESGKSTKIDMTPLRNLWDKTSGNISHIIEKHHSLGKTWGLN